MEIKNRREQDPVAGLAMMDACMHWALLAAEEVTGKRGLNIVLREAGLERLIDNYPPNELTVSYQLTGADYAALFAGLVNFFGRAGKSMLLRVEDGGDKILYISETCPMCAGKAASKPICQSFSGSLQESIHWATGKEALIEEVECRAMGAPACVWEIDKRPRG